MKLLRPPRWLTAFGTRFMPFADAASPELPLGRLLRLALFQAGKKAEAAPWLEKSVARGEPRAQLVLGTMLFNGDGVPRDYPRAYALMSLAPKRPGNFPRPVPDSAGTVFSEEDTKSFLVELHLWVINPKCIQLFDFFLGCVFVMVM